MNKRLTKKGQAGLGGLSPAILTLVIVAIIAAVGAIVVNDLQGTLSTQNTNSTAFNVTTSASSGINNITEQMPLLGTVIVFAVIIAVVIGFFATRTSRGV